MKSIIYILNITAAILVIGGQTFCQEKNSASKNGPVKPSHRAYGSLCLGFPENVSGGLTYIHKSNYGGSIHVSNIAFYPDKSGRSMFGPPPEMEISLIAGHFVREFTFNTPFVRIGLEAGPSMLWYTKKENVRPSGTTWFFTVYDYDETSGITAGLSLRFKLEFPLLLVAGLETALVANLNPARSFLGVEFGITLGKVRGKRNRK